MEQDGIRSRAHGRDERIRIENFYEGQEFLYRLVKALSGGGIASQQLFASVAPSSYSARIAITGSTRVARHAGTKLATSPTTSSVVVTRA